MPEPVVPAPVSGLLLKNRVFAVSLVSLALLCVFSFFGLPWVGAIFGLVFAASVFFLLKKFERDVNPFFNPASLKRSFYVWGALLLVFALFMLLEWVIASAFMLLVLAGMPLFWLFRAISVGRQTDDEKAVSEAKALSGRREKFLAKQASKGLVEYKGLWLPPDEAQKRQKIDFGLTTNFSNLDGQEFEVMCANLFRQMGYDVQVVHPIGNFGLHLLARKGGEAIGIQLFTEKALVSAESMGRLLAEMKAPGINAAKGIIISTAGFEVKAKVAAKGNKVELWDAKDLSKAVGKYLIQRK